MNGSRTFFDNSIQYLCMEFTFNEEEWHTVRPETDQRIVDVVSGLPVRRQPPRHARPVQLQRPHPALRPRHASAPVEVEHADTQLVRPVQTM